MVVDDGSSDATQTVVERIAARDPRVKLVRQAHGGPARARNTGATIATGEWLLFLDSDDRLQRDALAALAGVMFELPAADVVCGGIAGTRWLGTSRWWWRRTRIVDAFPTQLLFSIAAPRVQLIAVGLRRAVFVEAGGFDVDYPTSEDRELLVRVTAGHPIAFTPTIVATYDERADGRAAQAVTTGATIVAHRRMLHEVVAMPAVQRRIAERGTAEAAWLNRLCRAHLLALDAVDALRAATPRDAVRFFDDAVALCESGTEVRALVVRIVYLIVFPATDPLYARSRASRWLLALAHHTRHRSMHVLLPIAAAALWARGPIFRTDAGSRNRAAATSRPRHP